MALRSHIKKDYLKKDFSNPYFNRKKKSTGFNTGFYIKIISLILIFYVAIYSDLFKLNQFTIVGLEMIDQNEFNNITENYLNSWRWYLVPQNNLLFFNRKAFKETIRSHYNLKNLNIDLSWKKLAIAVEEKVSHLIVYNLKDQGFYFTDLNGIILRQIDQEKIGEYWDKYPIYNLNRESVIVGDQIISQTIVNFILEVDNQLKNAPFDVQGYEEREEKEINLVVRGGWRVYMDTNTEADKIVKNLLLVYNEEIKNADNLEYIDLRFGNKVFYK